MLALGVVLLIAGVVDTAALGALHGLIKGNGDGVAVHSMSEAVTQIEAHLTHAPAPIEPVPPA